MNKMKRTVAFIAVVVGMTLAGGAAQAASSISIVWAQSASDTITGTSPSDAITALIILQGDSVVGVSGVQLSFTYNTVELDFVNMTENAGAAAKAGAMGNQFAPLNGTNTTFDEGAGTIDGFDSATLHPVACTGCTITLGSIQFHVTGAVESGAPDDVLSAGAVNDAFNNDVSGSVIHNGAEVVPEPTTALLVVGGLLGLGYAGRRSVR